MASLEAPASPTLSAPSEKLAHCDKPAAATAAAAPQRSIVASILAALPAWVSGPLQSSRAWKVLLRSWIAVFTSFVILLPDASLRTMGTTSFFALITSLFLPPYFPLQLTIFLLATLMLGLLAGWGLGLAAMRAANAVRDPALLQAAAAQVQASIQATPAFQVNPALAKTSAIFAGVFLDVRATAVYGVFLALGAFVFGLVRAYAPKLLFLSIFGTIAIDIFCSIGPLFPTARYTLLNSTALSIAAYMGIALVTTVLVFPESMSHAALAALAEQLARVEALMALSDSVFAAAASAPDAIAGTGSKPDPRAAFKALRAHVITAQQRLLARRWNGDDVRALEEPTVALITRVGCLLNLDPLASTSPSPALLAVLPALDAATRPLRRATATALAAVRVELLSVNTTRWRGRSAGSTVLDGAAEQLRSAIGAFQVILLVPSTFLLNPVDGNSGNEAALLAAHGFSAGLLAVADAALALATAVQALNTKRPVKARLWAPTHMRGLWKLLRARESGPDGAFGEDVRTPEATPEAESFRRDPDSRPPSNAVQRVMHGIYAVYKWTGSAEGVFTLKYVVISLAMWLPAVFRRTAHFYYVEKGIWALIMAQMTLNIYAADQIYNYITRLGGTFVGLGLGLIAWYAGNGTGNGNPYGAAAAVGVTSFPLVFLRVVSPERYLAGNVMCCATFALVVGYSWIDGHSVQFASPGIGWSVAWKRWALVVVGSAASFVLMMFPARSGRKAVRRRNAAAITALGDVYASLVSVWIGGSAPPANSDGKPAPADAERTRTAAAADTSACPMWGPPFRARLLALAADLNAIGELAALAPWEGGLRGRWPAAEYQRLADVQADMLAGLAQLGTALSQLEDEAGGRALAEGSDARVLDPAFIADVLASFALVSQALYTGAPLRPARLFSPDASLAVGGAAGNGASLADVYRTSALGAVAQVLQGLDELHAVATDLCGAVPFPFPVAGWLGARAAV